MKMVFPIIENNIFKPKVPCPTEKMRIIGKGTDAYGYEFTRWKLDDVLTFWNEGREHHTDEVITYIWKAK